MTGVLGDHFGKHKSPQTIMVHLENKLATRLNLFRNGMSVVNERCIRTRRNPVKEEYAGISFTGFEGLRCVVGLGGLSIEASTENTFTEVFLMTEEGAVETHLITEDDVVGDDTYIATGAGALADEAMEIFPMSLGILESERVRQFWRSQHGTFGGSPTTIAA